MATTPRQQTFAEQSKALALLEMRAHPELVLDKTRPLPKYYQDNLEDLVKEMGYIWLLQEQKRNPQYLP